MSQSFHINEYFFAKEVKPEIIDTFWAEGWRHFGEYFFRYSLGYYEFQIRQVIPLRIRLADFTFSKNQRRNLKKNQDLKIIIRPIAITDEKIALFERHKQRFNHGVPQSIYDFLSPAPASVPCKALEFCVYENENLLAVSFLAIGETAVSSIYAMFEPTETKRGLGIFTMLLEIDFAIKTEKTFYYQGYCYQGNSFYDYKKRFSALEKFDWLGNWKKFDEII